MKFWGLIIYLILCMPALADTVQQNVQDNTSLTTSQHVNFETCTKMFAVNKEKLFYLTLASISANKFTVNEIQTAKGYIIFSAAGNKYLATISGIDSLNSILKITPCNNIYYFQPGIPVNTFKYIDLNLNMEIKG